MDKTIKNTISTILTVGTINFWTIGFSEVVCFISSGILVAWSVSSLFIDEGWSEETTILPDNLKDEIDECVICRYKDNTSNSGPCKNCTLDTYEYYR